MDRKQLLKMKAVKLGSIASNPQNPREDFQDQTLGESIEELSMIDPIDVRPISEEDQVADGIQFVVCDGDRRLDLLKEIHPADHQLTVGKEVLIHDLMQDKAFDFNVTKNMQRKNYNLREECNIVQHYKEQGLSQREIKKKCNRSKGWVVDRLNLLKESPEVQARIFSGELDLTEYRTKVVACDHPEESSLAGKLVQAGVVRETIAIEGPEEKPITKPPKISCPKEFFEDLKDAFPNVRFIDVIPSGAYTAFNIETDNEGTLERINKIIQNLHQVVQEKVEAKKSRPAKQVGPRENRTTYFTQEQFAAIKPQLTEHEYQSHQIIGDHVNVLWRNDQFHYNAIQWILENKDKFPLDEFQLKRYTDLPQEEIQKLVEDSIQQEAEERVESKPEGLVKEAWTYVSKQEYDSLLPSIKALITAEEPIPETEDQRCGRNLQLFFSSWEDEAILHRWIKPSREHLEPILQFPASTFMSANLKDILIDEKQLKKHFPNVYQELKQLQNFCKNIKQISLRSMEEITKAAKRLEVFMREVDLDLQHLKKSRRISGSEEQHLKICQKCLQPKWLTTKRDLCGNCEVSNNKQNKKTAAATSSGGQH